MVEFTNNSIYFMSFYIGTKSHGSYYWNIYGKWAFLGRPDCVHSLSLIVLEKAVLSHFLELLSVILTVKVFTQTFLE